MPRDPARRALKICAIDCLSAANGHGRRWAVERCARTLAAQRGAADPTPIERQAAQAMRAVAEAISTRSAT